MFLAPYQIRHGYIVLKGSSYRKLCAKGEVIFVLICNYICNRFLNFLRNNRNLPQKEIMILKILSMD